MALRSIFRGVSSSSLVSALNFQSRRRCCDSASSVEHWTAADIYYVPPSTPRISASDGSTLAKYVPPGLPFLVRDFGTHDGLFLERRYRDELVLGRVTHFINPNFRMQFMVYKEHRDVVFETITTPDGLICIDMLNMGSAMWSGLDPSPNQSKKDYLEGFDNFLETKGINTNTLKFLFRRFETGMKPPARTRRLY